jgi:AcrR family transcriptional regulator
MAKVSRDDIIRAAVHLFNQNGYHATSMQDIARAVAIRKPSLYHHFDSKEAILLAILDTGMERLITQLETVVSSDQPCTSKLHAAIHCHATTIAHNLEGASVFLREDRGLGDEYLRRYLTRRDHFEGLIRRIVQQGVTEGVFRQVDVAIAVNAVLGMVNWMTRWYNPQGRLSADQIADQFADLVMHGLSREP